MLDDVVDDVVRGIIEAACNHGSNVGDGEDGVEGAGADAGVHDVIPNDVIVAFKALAN